MIDSAIANQEIEKLAALRSKYQAVRTSMTDPMICLVLRAGTVRMVDVTKRRLENADFWIEKYMVSVCSAARRPPLVCTGHGAVDAGERQLRLALGDDVRHDFVPHAVDGPSAETQIGAPGNPASSR